MVPGAGFEPAWGVTPGDFKSPASTSSAIPAGIEYKGPGNGLRPEGRAWDARATARIERRRQRRKSMRSRCSTAASVTRVTIPQRATRRRRLSERIPSQRIMLGILERGFARV